MPLFMVRCQKCQRAGRRLLASVADLKDLPCRYEGCDGLVIREAVVPTLHNKEVIAQGHMLKPVERFTDAQKLYEERSKMDPRKPE